MRFFNTVKNIWSVEDLRKRIGITLLLVIIYRFGCYVVLPGINPDALTAMKSFTADGLMQLLDMFSGGAFSQASIFALGIMPYITASIVIQLLGMVLPSFQKMQREGESGRTKLNQYTRYLTVIILILQGPAYLLNLKYQIAAAGGHVEMGFWMVVYMTIVLAAGSMFIMWLGERIDQKGVGNGISFIILIGIIARMPEAFLQEFTQKFSNAAGGGLVLFLLEIIVLLAVIAGAVLLVQGTRKVPVQYAKRVVGRKMYGGQSSHLPIKVALGGVLPIIFASSILSIPSTINLFLKIPAGEGFWGAFFAAFSTTGWLYMVLYFLFIIMFAYFYTSIQYNPVEMANNLKANNGTVPGIRPGAPTADYIRKILSRITLIGAMFLAVIAMIPLIYGAASGMGQMSIGGTSIIIVVGVALETVKQLESQMMMRHYKGFLD